MNGWTTTSVWRINGRLVVADEVEEAIALYRKYKTPNDADIEKIERVFGDECNGAAITVEGTDHERHFAEQLAKLTEENEKLKARIPAWKKHHGETISANEAKWLVYGEHGLVILSTLADDDEYIELSELKNLPVTGK